MRLPAVHGRILATLLTASVSAAGAGDRHAVDKDQYHLFNPTPRHLMRDMSADRPDSTESPYTVDAGHFQIEMSVLDYARDGADAQFAALPVNLKVGLTNDIDLQLVLAPYNRVERAGADGASVSFDGFGDTQVRVKVNVWGNDGAPFALALLPFVHLPTGADDLSVGRIEGGFIVPAAFDVGGGWGLGLQAEIDFVRDGTEAGYGVAFVHTAVLGRDITDRLGGFAEYVGVASDGLGAPYEAYGAAGATYALSDDMQIDVGITVGLNAAADDLNVFTGLSIRL